MLFNSLHFFLFFPVVTAVYFLLPRFHRCFFLLLASCYFYIAFIPIYILILLFTIGIDYVAGILIENAAGAARKRWLVLSLVANVGVLAAFKYLNFFNLNMQYLFGLFGKTYLAHSLGIILPIGLSFHTFQSMSYTIEVYHGRQKAERHLGLFALYVMFYPQLVAGPIERPQNLLHQFHNVSDFDFERLIEGLQIMLWGLFKKVVIADRLALFVNQVYGSPERFSGPALILATVFFAFQIYCDFSGYSDIAIGAARVMGFKLMNNFLKPYEARSILDFWRRWHVSLSTWFRDYVFMPLAGSRFMGPMPLLTILLTFLISGLWHGANWTFIVWGGLNGLYLVLYETTTEGRQKLTEMTGLSAHPRLLHLVQVISTFSLVCFAWIFFRAKDLRSGLYISGHLFSGWKNFFTHISTREMIGTQVFLHQGKWEFGIAVSMIGALVLLQRRSPREDGIPYGTGWQREALVLLLSVAVLFLGKFTTTDFIYFQF